MRTSFLAALLLAGAVALGGGSARAQDYCEAAAQAGLKKIFESLGAPVDVGEAAYEVWAAYVKSPDDAKLDAALAALSQGAAGIVFPAYGVALNAGKIAVGGVEYTIEEAKAQQQEAFLCGGSSFGDAFTKFDFFSLNAAQALSKGINCDNFAERVTNLEKLATLKTLWDGYYSRELIKLRGRENAEDTRQRLYEGWAALEKRWKLHWGTVAYDKLREDLRREGAAAAQQTACAAPAPAASIDNPRTAKGNFVDRCLFYASGCDNNDDPAPAAKPAANEFCKRQGYQGVAPAGSRWSYKAPTEILSSGQLCNDARGCGGLDFVKCR